MEQEKKKRLIDVMLGGLGGAIAAVIMNQYFAGVEREVRVNAKEEILKAKREVIEGIQEARSKEKERINDAIAQLERARVYSENTIERARVYSENIKRRTQEFQKKLSDQEERVDKLTDQTIKAITGREITPNAVAAILRDGVIHELMQEAVVAFASDKCPSGWERYPKAAGRMIVGVGKAEDFPEKNYMTRVVRRPIRSQWKRCLAIGINYQLSLDQVANMKSDQVATHLTGFP